MHKTVYSVPDNTTPHRRKYPFCGILLTEQKILIFYSFNIFVGKKLLIMSQTRSFFFLGILVKQQWLKIQWQLKIFPLSCSDYS